MKKILNNSFLLGLMICICLLFSIKADAEELKTVSEVSLQLTTEADGLTLEEFKNSLTILSDGITIPTKDQAPDGWFGAWENGNDAYANVLEAGKGYGLKIFLLPKEGYKWPVNVGGFFHCSINGYGQGVWSNNYGVSCELMGEFLLITVKNYKIDQWIESVELLVPDYKIGNQGNFKMATTTTESITVDTGVIIVEDSIICNGEIKPDTEYRIQIAFLEKAGYSAARLQRQNIRVMGKVPDEFYMLENGAYYVGCDLDILHEGGVANCHSEKLCSGCGEPYGELDPANHDGKTELRNVIQATCKQQGYSGDTYCLSCGEMVSAGTQTPISDQHSYDAGVITTSPTETDAGVKTYTCTICQTTKTEEVPKLESSNGTQVEGSQDDGTKDDGAKENGANENGSGEDTTKGDSNKGNSNKGDSKQENSDNTIAPPAINSIITDSQTGIKYRVTKAGATGGSVEFQGPKSKKIKQITIPAIVKIGGISYKVTSIAKNAFIGCKKLKKVVIGKNITKIGSKAFYGCKNLKTIIFKTTKLKSSKVGKKAFTGTAKKAKVTVPKKSYKKYKKFLYKKGINKKAKIKKAKK